MVIMHEKLGKNGTSAICLVCECAYCVSAIKVLVLMVPCPTAGEGINDIEQYRFLRK